MSSPIFVTISGARGPAGGSTGTLPYTAFGAQLLLLSNAAALAALAQQGSFAANLSRGAATASLGANTANFFTGTATVTWTLPAVATNIGAYVWVKNQGSAAVTVAPQGGDHIFDAASVNALSLNPGEAQLFLNDGYFWNTVG